MIKTAVKKRTHELRGRVVRGDGRGRSIGYPTANLTRHFFRFHPVPRGVYAAWVIVNKKTYAAAAVVGVDKKLEVHLLDWRGTLNGRLLSVKIVKRLRPIQRFKSERALVQRITQDLGTVRRLLRADLSGKK